MRLIIEGSDFSGKSTISDIVSLRLSELGIPIRRVDSCCTTEYIRKAVLFVHNSLSIPNFIKSLVFHFAYIAELICSNMAPYNDQRSGVVTIQESCHIRVLAHDIVLGRAIQKAALLAAAHIFPWKPPLLFFLHCPVSVRARRWEETGAFNDRDALRFGSEIREHISVSNELRRQAQLHQFEEIDTSKVSAYAAANLITRRILEQRNGNGNE